MNLLEHTISAIRIPDPTAAESVDAAFTKKMSVDFGRLKAALLRYIRITGERHPAPPQTRVVISCADHGVAAESVSAYPPETTLNMMCNYLIARGGAANAAANYAGADLIVADLGVNTESTDIPGLRHHSIARGTMNMTKGPAMTRAQAIASIETGIALANECADAGDRCILPGEMGISNTTSSAAIVASFLGLIPEEVTGRGANISDERLAHKVEIVRRALEINLPDPHDGLDVLSKVGGFELGCIAGLILGSAARGMLVILDGANTTSAALVAHALAPSCTHYLLASHASLTEHSHPHALRHLGLTPMLRLDIRLSEAAGSSIALRMLGHMLNVWETVDISAKDASHHSPIGSRCVPLCPQAEKAAPSLPDQAAMDACQYRLDNLAKPIHSLGHLERIAVQLAGTMANERPPIDARAALLLVTQRDLSKQHEQLLTALTTGTDISVHILCTAETEGDAYRAAYDLARTHPLLILGTGEFDGNTTAQAILADALRGAAAGSSLILPGDAEAERAACRVEEDAVIRAHILHVLPAMLTIDAPLAVGAAGLLGMENVRAALHALNGMKTFTETSVAVAIDGVGAGRQVRE
ncbi:nicotinate-nucleotide--dimethylbenzimidazole phosphoribosyltransferase [uncultured Selenomonas sp.]|uniref:nicotinate-nucleotide--dimethylbenzimidazole phosphoribosyltransferase n=1 Tax=uncultured Selenomonas sp. TaxID=159275 RepID=UPI0028F0445D|nr:nicotinate-nucleotide--dimethylbenzimidazole phosphoribosyltransferase [uncultured Selenomonas sp.]